MTDETEPREGVYAEWEWNSFRQCWEYLVPVRIYPMPDGMFVTSYAETWNTPDPIPTTFEEAERAALEIEAPKLASWDT